MKKNETEWYCPLLKKNIDEGYCLDINYERLEYFNSGVIDSLLQVTRISKEELNKICEECKNQPLLD